MNSEQHKLLFLKLLFLSCFLLITGSRQFLFSQAVTISSAALEDIFVSGSPIAYNSEQLMDTLK